MIHFPTLTYKRLWHDGLTASQEAAASPLCLQVYRLAHGMPGKSSPNHPKPTSPQSPAPDMSLPGGHTVPSSKCLCSQSNAWDISTPTVPLFVVTVLEYVFCSTQAGPAQGAGHRPRKCLNGRAPELQYVPPGSLLPCQGQRSYQL